MRSVSVHYRVADLAGIDLADVVTLDRHRNAAAALVEARVLRAMGAALRPPPSAAPGPEPRAPRNAASRPPCRGARTWPA